MANAIEGFDLENPVLPKAIKKRALKSGGYPYDEKMDDDAVSRRDAGGAAATGAAAGRPGQDRAAHRDRVRRTRRGRQGRRDHGVSREPQPALQHDVALPKPTDREKTQWYFQRYVDWLPAAGEQVLFDRSWYNRAGVEPVMGFCTPEQTDKFLEEVPHFEKLLVNDGIHLFKFWLAIGREMQIKRFHDRRHDPLKVWKLSPVDMKALEKFDDYSVARDRMFEATSSEHAPWHVILNNDKKRGQLDIIRSVLHAIDYEGKDEALIGVDEIRASQSARRRSEKAATTCSRLTVWSKISAKAPRLLLHPFDRQRQKLVNCLLTDPQIGRATVLERRMRQRAWPRPQGVVWWGSTSTQALKQASLRQCRCSMQRGSRPSCWPVITLQTASPCPMATWD